MDQVQVPPEIRSFLEGLLQDANMVLTDDLKEEMIKELFARLDSYLTTVIVDNMPAEHLEAFIKLNEENKSKEEVETFIKDHLPNAQDVFVKAFADFRETYLGEVANARDNQTQAK